MSESRFVEAEEPVEIVMCTVKCSCGGELEITNQDSWYDHPRVRYTYKCKDCCFSATSLIKYPQVRYKTKDKENSDGKGK